MPPSAGEGTEGATLREGWLQIACCFLAVFSAYIVAFMLGPIIVPMGRDLGASVPAMGQAAALMFVSWGIGAPLIGPLSDRFGRKPVILAGLAGLALTCAATASIQSYAGLLLCRLATGVFGGCVPPTCVASIGDRFSAKARGNAMALSGAGISAGLLAGIPFLAWVADRAGWRLSFLLAGGAALAALALAAWAFPSPRRPARAETYLGSFGWAREPAAWHLIAGNVLERVIVTLFLTYVSVLFLRRYGLSLASVAGLISIMSVGNAIGGLAGGPLAAWRYRIQAVRALALLQGGLIALQFSLLPPLALSAAAGFLYSFAGQMSRPAVMDGLLALAPRSKGSVIGGYAMSNQLGHMLGAALGGAVIAWADVEGLGWLGLASGIASAHMYGKLLRPRAERMGEVD
ncbi:MAG: MFS transporter [Candidatus Tectomicrobia bacterium]|uniref:MFS transporter n=1 Tax=Tectimicrobiota bacterium TaxID=2528274 RepID=A0A932MNH9_UNCTE|nr:MFS transporter [Candidatus Tectomicrobia bacterium]